MLIPTDLLFKLSIAKDRVRFLRLYSGISLIVGLGIAFAAHTPTYSSEPAKPSLFYKLHLKRLLAQGKITEHDYNKYIDFKQV